MTTRLTAIAVVLLVACGGQPDQVSARAPVQQEFNSIDKLLAPIALYPDSLLAQILMSAEDPTQVGRLNQWLTGNAGLKGTELQDAAVAAGFDASFVALTLFPTVVSKMAAQTEWVTLLGQAFTADKSAVFASIQRLRKQAQEVGTLKTSPQQEVSTQTTSGGEQVIVIEPTNPQIVYVPQYNTEVVYTQAPTTTTVVVQDDNTDEAIAAGLIGFTAGIAIGATFDSPYYYGPMGFYGGGYMYNDAWDDYYDHREDAREDWMDHREDIVEERGDRMEDRGERTGERAESRQDTRGNTQEQRTERAQTRSENRPEGQAQRATTSSQRATSASTQTSRTGSSQARGHGTTSTRTQSAQRSSGSSDAFSGYSSGKSQRASSSRGQQSRSSGSRGGGGRRR